MTTAANVRASNMLGPVLGNEGADGVGPGLRTPIVFAPCATPRFAIHVRPIATAILGFSLDYRFEVFGGMPRGYDQLGHVGAMLLLFQFERADSRCGGVHVLVPAQQESGGEDGQAQDVAAVGIGEPEQARALGGTGTNAPIDQPLMADPLDVAD
jgi:hypothetical protein